MLNYNRFVICKTCIGRSIGENRVILENYTPMCLAKMPLSLLISQSLTMIVVVQMTCFNRDIRTQLRVASTHAVVLMYVIRSYFFYHLC
jgi:hypothetical protein